jgi:hypothetical protein
MKRDAFALSAVALASILSCGAAFAETYTYVRWEGRDRAVVDQEKGQVVVGGDAVFKTEFCRATDTHFCFRSAQHAFAVPKQMGKSTTEWTVQGIRYEVVGRGLSVSVFGRTVDNLYLIRRPPSSAVLSDKAWIFLYSPRDGLVAYAAENLRATFWLEGSRGFGAHDDSPSP